MVKSLRIMLAAGGLLAMAVSASAQQALSFAGSQEKPRGIIDMIFGGPKRAAPSNDFTPPTPPMGALNVNSSPAQPKKVTAGASSPRSGGGGSLAVCVRTCDGFFFPVNYEGARGTDRYQEACQASCPNAQTEVYFMRQGGDLHGAATAKGRSYTQLPAAFKYREQRDATCTCKDANQSWAQVLAPAEELVRHNKNDVVVTTERSEQSARPQQTAPVATSAAKDKLASAQPARPAAE